MSDPEKQNSPSTPGPPRTYRVVIPEEAFAILEWEDEGLPAICVVNQSIANFEPKVVFGWHLSIAIDCELLAGNGMPSQVETQILDQFGKELDRKLKAKGNALFLARITWNGVRRLLYRVYDPEVANEYLMGIRIEETQVRPFAFRMTYDKNWEFARRYLRHWEAEPGAAADGGGM